MFNDDNKHTKLSGTYREVGTQSCCNLKNDVGRDKQMNIFIELAELLTLV
jgi:hypothetical protein